MLKEIRARYEHGKLVFPDGTESPPDGAEVIVVYQGAPSDAGTDDLYGAWAGKFPKDFDLDEALKEVRAERRWLDTI